MISPVDSADTLLIGLVARSSRLQRAGAAGSCSAAY